MNIAEQFGVGVAVMVYQHPLKKSLRDQRAAIEKAAAPLAKLAALQDRLQKLDRDRLQKLHGGDLVQKAKYLEASNEIEREALAALDEISAQLTEAMAASEQMHKALPAFRRWALFGVPDPDAIKEPPPPSDPLEPIVNLGQYFVVEKTITFDDRGRPKDPTLTPFPMPQRQQQPRVNPTDAFLAHNRRRGED